MVVFPTQNIFKIFAVYMHVSSVCILTFPPLLLSVLKQALTAREGFVLLSHWFEKVGCQIAV